MTSARVVQNPRIIAQNAGDELVLYNADTRHIHILNDTARFIWDLCDGHHSPADIEHLLRANFDLTPGFDALNDIKETIDALITKQLLFTS